MNTYYGRIKFFNITNIKKFYNDKSEYNAINPKIHSERAMLIMVSIFNSLIPVRRRLSQHVLHPKPLPQDHHTSRLGYISP